ncbi:MAG: phosphoribosylanthranilate isomerase [Rhodothermales bacterium]
MTKLKICGLTTLEDARFCSGAGADYLGFICYPGSKRYIAPKAIQSIAEWIYGSELVGVFVDESADHVNEVADAAGLHLVQLHGDEPSWLCAEVDKPIIKAFRVKATDTADALRYQFDDYADHVDYFLLDAYHDQLYGGTGKVFNWAVAQALAKDYPIFLAGGLSASNIAEAVGTVEPFAVDVSSSLESAPGVKDFDKLNAFFDAFNPLRDDSAI